MSEAVILTGQQRKILREGVIRAYPNPDELRILLAEQMEVQLGVIVSDGAYNTRVFDLIADFDASGRIEQFIKLIVQGKENSPYLTEVKNEFKSILENKVPEKPITDEERKKNERLVLEQAERNHQQKLKQEAQQAYENKRNRYEQEFMSDSSATIALLVGIESYQISEKWNLNGPVADVIRMAQWLKSQGVPSENLCLCLSPLKQNQNLLGSLKEYHLSGANLEDILDKLESVKRQSASLFIFYWGGHGWSEPSGERRLFCSDTQDKAWRNLDFNDLLVAMRTDLYKSIQKQLFIVDTCVNYAKNQGISPPRYELEKGQPIYCEQFVLFAGKLGNRVINLDAEQTGLYTRELLKELEQSQGVWPPDVKAISEHLQSRFVDLRNQGLTRQTPIYSHLWHRDWLENVFESVAPNLNAEMDAVGLATQGQASRTLKTRLQCLPAIFTEGLCKGRVLEMQTNQYFVSHGFEGEVLTDWRQALTDALAKLNGGQELFQAYFAGDSLLGGFRLCGIVEKLYTTRFSTFLLTTSQDRNVYLELGIAIGLGVPFFLIQHYEAQIPLILEGLDRYKSGSFRKMSRELGSQFKEYDFGVVRFVSDLPPPGSQSNYLIAAGELYEDEDFEGSVVDALADRYSNLKPQFMTQNTRIIEVSAWSLEQLVESIQTSRFAIYRIDEDCSPATFLALGINIGLNRPFVMLHRANTKIPLDLRGMGMYQFPNFVTLQQEIVARHQKFFDKYGS